MRTRKRTLRCRGCDLMPRDRQRDEPVGRCPRCGRELYGLEKRCPRCGEERI